MLEPVVLEGRLVRLEPLTPDHHVDDEWPEVKSRLVGSLPTPGTLGLSNW